MIKRIKTKSVAKNGITYNKNKEEGRNRDKIIKGGSNLLKYETRAYEKR